MRKTDVDEERIKAPPSDSTILFSGRSQEQGYTITRIDLRRYVERKDDRLGEYSLLTVLVETDSGSVEMKYDEGFRGQDALESAASMLRQNVGLAAIINRALIELRR